MVARSEPPTDPRQYVRISMDIIANPKLDAIDDPAAAWAHVYAIVYCGKSLTDGHFQPSVVLRRANVGPHLLDALVKQDLWHLPGHDCERCPQPRDGYAYVHDFLAHQRSAAEVRELSQTRSEAGRKGAESRWGKPGEKKTTGKANAMASARQQPKQTDANVMADKRRGDERELPSEVLFGAPPSASTPATAKKVKTATERGTRIPDDFGITKGMREWAAEDVPGFDIDREFPRFRDYWRSQTGQRAVRKEWPAVWRNWMRRAYEEQGTSRTPGSAVAVNQDRRGGYAGGYPDRNGVAVRDAQPRQSAGARKFQAAQELGAELDAELASGGRR